MSFLSDLSEERREFAGEQKAVAKVEECSMLFKTLTATAEYSEPDIRVQPLKRTVCCIPT